MISGSLCRHLKIAGRFVIKVLSPYQPTTSTLQHIPWFVLAMMLLRLTQKLCQRRGVQTAESTSGQARCDLLEQPGVAIRVAERSKGKVAAVTGVRPTDATVAFGTELSTRFPSMEHLTDLDSAGNELFASSFNIGNGQVETLGGARRGRRYLRAESD